MENVNGQRELNNRLFYLVTAGAIKQLRQPAFYVTVATHPCRIVYI